MSSLRQLYGHRNSSKHLPQYQQPAKINKSFANLPPTIYHLLGRSGTPLDQSAIERLILYCDWFIDQSFDWLIFATPDTVSRKFHEQIDQSQKSPSLDIKP